MVFVQLPFRTVLHLTLDGDTHRVVALERGEISWLHEYGEVEQGEAVAELASATLEQEMALFRAESEMITLARDAVANATASDIKAVEDRATLNNTQRAVVKSRRERLTATAPTEGFFAPLARLRPGETLTEAARSSG